MVGTNASGSVRKRGQCSGRPFGSSQPIRAGISAGPDAEGPGVDRCRRDRELDAPAGSRPAVADSPWSPQVFGGARRHVGEVHGGEVGGANSCIGSTYVSPIRSPRWSTCPSWFRPGRRSSRRSRPAPTVGRRATRDRGEEEYEVRSRCAWRTTTWRVPADRPRRTPTVPAPAACTGVPGAAAKSTPRWPRPYRRQRRHGTAATTAPGTGRIQLGRAGAVGRRRRDRAPAPTARARTTTIRDGAICASADRTERRRVPSARTRRCAPKTSPGDDSGAIRGPCEL